MKKQLLLKGLMGLTLLSAALSCNKDDSRANQTVAMANKNNLNLKSSFSTSSAYWTLASQTHNFIYGNILTQYNSYRANTTNNANSAFEWYNASQIYADAASFANQGGTAYQTYMNNTYTFMSFFWDTTAGANGGYWSGTSISGSGNSGQKFVDDNSLTGIAYLEAYTATGDSRYLTSAQAVANWLMNCGLWDTTFGGGFWQSTQKLDKPTQTNGLAMQFFLKMYNQNKSATYYLSWANSIRAWLEGNMYDSTSRCYLWQIESSGTKDNRLETYTNAIMVEADLLYASIVGDNSYVTKAQTLGSAMNTALWHSTSSTTGVYLYSNQTGNVNPCWCVWGSQAMMLLYARDGNTAWLNYAQQNIDWLNAHCRNITNFGYYQYVQEDGTSPTIDYEGVDQAWMQREQALLSNYK